MWACCVSATVGLGGHAETVVVGIYDQDRFGCDGGLEHAVGGCIVEYKVVCS